MSIFDLLELEEQVGRAWHRLAGRPTSFAHYPESAVELASLRGALSVFFRALGGDPALRVLENPMSRSDHRLSWRQRLAMSEERLPIAKRDEETLQLPARLDYFPDRALNRDLYFWLAAFLGDAGWDYENPPADALQADVSFLRSAAGAADRTCRRYPGLVEVYRRLSEAALAMRPARHLTNLEAAEAAIIHLLGGPSPKDPSGRIMLRAIRGGPGALGALHAPMGYRRLLMPPVWGIVEAAGRGSARPEDDPEVESPAADDSHEGSRYAAERNENEQSDRDDPLILNRFEKILGWSEMVNVNRPTEDEDEAAARRAADDHDHLSLGRQQRKAATRLRLELELAPSAADGDALEGGAIYPEWDFRRAGYLPDFCRVIERTAGIEGEAWLPDEVTRRRIRHVRRQFEALRPRRQLQRRQLDGFELDTDAAVRARSLSPASRSRTTNGQAMAIPATPARIKPATMRRPRGESLRQPRTGSIRKAGSGS